MVNIDALNKAVAGANLKETRGKQAKPQGTRPKNLKRVPEYVFTDHADLKRAGLTALNLSDYMIEATREKLLRDQGGQ
jgi:hypothetical protein